MKSPLKWMFPRDIREVHTEGSEARVKAERELAQTVAQTPYYEGLGRELRALRERNHIADRIRATIREA